MDMVPLEECGTYEAAGDQDSGAPSLGASWALRSKSDQVNRTDRLYAIVEELRAVAPRPRSVAWLAHRFGVSTRTLERDLDALRESGVPIFAMKGRTGGYVVDKMHSLPPLGLTAVEALAITAGLSTIACSPLSDSARSARQKVLATLPDLVRASERTSAGQIAVIDRCVSCETASATTLVNAWLQGRVVRLLYRRRDSSVSDRRDVEPMGWLQARHVDCGWYLLAWCRLRGAVRSFRYDRILEAALLPEAASRRRYELDAEVARIGARLLSEIDVD